MRFLIIAVCLGFVYMTGLTQLKAVPIGSDDWNSVKHLFNRHLDPPFTIAETINSVIQRSRDHGPLYFVLLNIWSEFTGRDLFRLGLLSVLFGLLAIAAAYRLALLTCDKETALVVMVITAFLAYFIYYTHVARMYSPLPLLAAWVLWSYWNILSSPAPVRWWLWSSLSISAAAIIYLHYFGIFLLAAIGIYHLVFAAKNRRWFGICLALVAAGFLFSPWLPVVADALAKREVPDSDSLPFLEAALAMLRVYSNGLVAPLLLGGAVAVLKHRQLNRSQRYVLIITCLIALLMLLANEIAPLLIARRIRYTIVLEIPLICALAIGLRALPRWRLFCLPGGILWILSFFLYSDSGLHSLYTNRLTLNMHKVPHYQDLLYDPSIIPAADEFVLSFHPDAPLHPRIVIYYGRTTGDLRGLIHIRENEDGEAVIQSSDEAVATLDGIASLNKLWVLYDPQQTDLNTMAVYTNWFARRFKPCKRYLERENSIIDYYLPAEVPCESITDEQPLRLRYNNGLEVASLTAEQTDDELALHFWFKYIPRVLTSVSLQIFDQAGDKLKSIDAVIENKPFAVYTLDIANLPAGEYTVKLVVYDFVSKNSHSGLIAEGEQRFEREVLVTRLSIGA